MILTLMKKLWKGLFCAAALFFFAASCQNSRQVSHLKLNVSSQYCAPTIPYRYNASFLPYQNTDSILSNSPELAARMSVHDILMANATGTLGLTNELIKARKDSSLNGRIKSLEISNRIQDHLFLLSTEIAGISAELDCEGERADLFAGYLDNINNKNTARLTGASIVVGALATVAAVMVNSNATQNAISIGGGLVSAGLGILTIKPSGKKIKFVHERNVLEDIWFAPEQSRIYSPFMWYMLKERRFSNNQQEPLVQTIKARWNKFELDQDMDEATIQLLFKNGGIYDADNLHTRATMLNQLQSTTRSISQDMQSLISSLNAIK